ncbi:MAG: MerC domain-containing protein [Opitutales bacterium]|jgi:hypothetical protein|nr:MerC domain-containing protein [Opitutales bacterium]MBT5167946.1 MerC domain-containing protein [Opitutales bacterium]MBT5813409.1 MerC domain-containing protein [Opitutales bacterium]MBT6379083.1 MerC domain-containing protein [Opitutales bacterium]MBT6769493.1 MerC domain-containing protein [Opitutales bacterium]
MNISQTDATLCAPQDRVWLDRAAILMAIVCGIHCLVTPFLLITMPIIGVTFWANENFHLWMLALVIPTTVLAAFTGCRKHKDRVVATCTALGLIILVSATGSEVSALHAADSSIESNLSTGTEACASNGASDSCCAVQPNSGGVSNASLAFPSLTPTALLNLAGGLLLIVGHARNFRLCRTRQCCNG